MPRTIRILAGLVLLTALLALGINVGTAATIQYANFNLRSCPALTSSGHEVITFDEGLKPGSLIVWEANTRKAIDADRAALIGEHVRKGGSLLIALDGNAGTGPFRLAFMLPTTAWQSLGNAAHRGFNDEIGVGPMWNKEIWPGEQPPLTTVPFHHKIKTVHEVERGLARYERFARKQPYLDLELKPWDPWYTRPLINRDWQSWIDADDIARSSLLVTGRYGAGRVAVFASSIKNAPAEMLHPLINWLTEATPVDPTKIPDANDIDMTIREDVGSRSLVVDISNKSGLDLPLTVLARILTWENAYLEDVAREISVSAGSGATVRLPLPERGAGEYQAITYRDAYIARVGVLSADGSELLRESRLSVDLTPQVTVRVSTHNLREKPYPFDAPDYTAQERTFQRRMGSPVMAYAYPEQDKIKAVATISNGLRNLAPLARAADLTYPDNPSIIAINDEAVHGEKQPRNQHVAYGYWGGTKGVENKLEFVFPQPVTVCAVTLNGAPDDFRFLHRNNPAWIRIEADGQVVAEDRNLESRFLSEHGLVSIRLSPRQVQTLRLTMQTSDPGKEPRLGEVIIEGTTGTLPSAVRGELRMVYVDALTGREHELARQEVVVSGGEKKQIVTEVVPDCLPEGVTPGRIEAQFTYAGADAATDSVPVMVMRPQKALEPMTRVEPPGSADLGFIVTRGFRNVFELGTGNQDMPGAWGTPDDLIWAYAKQLKQTGTRTPTKAANMYASEQDMRHYSTPWSRFPSGEKFFDVATPLLVERMKKSPKWKRSDRVVFYFSDRWDTGTSVGQMFTWPEMIAFDEHLAASGKPRLKGKTRLQLCAEINTERRAEWLNYLADNYMHDVRNMRQAFLAEGKLFIIRAQGNPMVPNKLVKELSEVIQAMSHDSTWGYRFENAPFTIGEQMAIKAFNPGWKMSDLLVWGYNSGVLNNPHWAAAVGTTEPSRRLQYDRAWRGCIDQDGQYQSIHTYGYALNANVSWTMNDHDWQECWRVQERRSLLYPMEPLGIGVIVRNRMDDLEDPIFSGGGVVEGGANKIIDDFAHLVSRLQDAGLPVSFSANLDSAAKWDGISPMVLSKANELKAHDATSLQKLKQRGVKLVAVAHEAKFAPQVANLLGISTDGTPLSAKVRDEVAGLRVLEHDGWVLVIAPSERLTIRQGRVVAKYLAEMTPLPIRYDEGLAGYGFRMGGQSFVVVEDWLEKARQVEVRILAREGATSASAVGMNEHRPFQVRREGNYWVVSFNMRPGDGEVICLQEARN